jgi:predicted small secreted protein
MNKSMRGLAVAVVLASALVAACGGGGEAASEAGKAGQVKSADSSGKSAAGAAATVKPSDPAQGNMAAAVADSKTMAPIDLMYDIPTKPEVGQSFTVELAVKPRLPSDALDVEIGDSPGIVIEGERASRFVDVEAGTPYKFTFSARGDAEGLYYIAVITKLSTQVESEGRAFSVPVVIGTPPAAQKTEPQKDASGQPVQSMPAREN